MQPMAGPDNQPRERLLPNFRSSPTGILPPEARATITPVSTVDFMDPRRNRGSHRGSAIDDRVAARRLRQPGPDLLRLGYLLRELRSAGQPAIAPRLTLSSGPKRALFANPRRRLA